MASMNRETALPLSAEQRWYHIGPPWNDSPGLIYAGSEDPHAGMFVADCGGWDDELVFGEPKRHPAESIAAIADRIVADHNATLDAARTPEAQWPDLANDIRLVDGNHDLGAGELAEALTKRGWSRTPGEPGLRTAAQAVLDEWDSSGDAFPFVMRALRAALSQPAEAEGEA
jgi:hypothetical protein